MDLNRTSVQFCAGNLYLRREICLFAEKFIRFLVNKYGKHIVYTDGGSWYPETCNVLGLKHYIHSSKEKSLIERVNQYFKDRTELFDNYYQCVKMNVIYFMYTTGYNSLFLTIIIQHFENYSFNELNDRGEYILS
ncbi:MAG TPA: hypothetical protein VMS35_07700 [Nitrososphaeraceae archaeon]|jgi:transposase-like protein|nr:hypothetical protein [Nitrososphaeraceae archaeon]